MITCSINKWTKDDVLKLTSVLWELYSDADCTKLLEQKEITSDNNPNVFTSNREIPVGVSYYIKATRKFASNPDTNHTLGPKPLVDHKVYLNNLIVPDYIYIEKPTIYVNDDDFKSSDSVDFEIKTSKFRSKEDGDSCTHLIITNGE